MSYQHDWIRKALALKDAHDIDGFVARFAPDGAMISPQGEMRGHAALRAWQENEARGFPEARTELTSITAEGDRIAFQAVVTTTNRGPFETPQGTLPPTGRTVVLPYAGVVQLEAGLAKTVSIYFDQMAFAAQLGLMPQPAEV